METLRTALSVAIKWLRVQCRGPRSADMTSKLFKNKMSLESRWLSTASQQFTVFTSLGLPLYG